MDYPVEASHPPFGLSGEIRESPLSPPLGTVRETFALTRLKAYFRRDLTWVLCTCL